MGSSGHVRDLAEQARKAMNDARLTVIVAQLCAAIEIEREAILHPGVMDLSLPARLPDVFAVN
jgi:hypothetical protein